VLTQDEFEQLIDDPTKTIEEDIIWEYDEDHSPAVEFQVEVTSEEGYPLFIKGSYNQLTRKLSYAIVHRSVGRIYALDLGADHRNPDREEITGGLHKHRWDVLYKDKKAYIPRDITASVDEPVEVWRQFCAESRITHNGSINEPPPTQLDLFL
jgi:hypothetical protein